VKSLLGQFEPLGITPQIFKAVKRALLFVENMHDHIAVVDDEPLAQRIAIHGMGSYVVVFFEARLDFARDGLDVRLGGAGTDDKKIGEAGNTTQIKRDDILGFFFRCIFRAKFCELLGFNGVTPCINGGWR
jgi:hypothetical protein